MGIPKKVEDYSVFSFWYYGRSRVKIQNGQVVEWEDKGNLKIR